MPLLSARRWKEHLSSGGLPAVQLGFWAPLLHFDTLSHSSLVLASHCQGCWEEDVTFASQLRGLCFPSEGRRDLSHEAFVAGSLCPGPARGGLGRSACGKVAGACQTERDLLHCDVTDAADGGGAWASPRRT